MGRFLGDYSYLMTALVLAGAAAAAARLVPRLLRGTVWWMA
jgi:hypothetical protein